MGLPCHRSREGDSSSQNLYSTSIEPLWEFTNLVDVLEKAPVLKLELSFSQSEVDGPQKLKIMDIRRFRFAFWEPASNALKSKGISKEFDMGGSLLPRTVRSGDRRLTPNPNPLMSDG